MNLIQFLLADDAFKQQVKYSYKTVNTSQVIMSSSEVHKYFYFICEGKVRVSLIGESDHLKLHPGIIELGPGEMFGELSLFNESSGIADIKALIETELIEVEVKTFEAFLENNPKIAYVVMREILNIMIGRLRHSNQALVKLLVWGIKNHKIDDALEE